MRRMIGFGVLALVGYVVLYWAIRILLYVVTFRVVISDVS